VINYDLIKEQIKIAAGEKIVGKAYYPQMHAIECRINAEDPDSFMPSPGTVKRFESPGGPGVRVDTHMYDGYRIPPNYDSMVGKLIVHGPDRATAIARMRIALAEMVVEGIKTNIPLQQRIMNDGGFQLGEQNIHYLEKRIAERKDKAIGIG
jgi:acetyl-CoA carboxylase biotin carboxylase subunit